MNDSRRRDKEIILRVVARFSDAAGVGYTITRWPDEEERSARACDAYAECPGQQALAIEHRIIPTFGPQKQHDAEFMRIFGELENELKNAFPYNLSLTVPMFGIQRGQNWAQIKRDVKAWLQANVAAIPTERSTIKIPGVPFDVTLNRDDDLPPLFTVARFLDEGLNVPEELVRSITTALVDKNDQLGQYRVGGDRTILVLESQDIALVSRATIYKAFLAAFAKVQPTNIDQVWLAETYEPEDWIEIYCLLAEQAFMDRINPENAMFGPRYTAEWLG